MATLANALQSAIDSAIDNAVRFRDADLEPTMDAEAIEARGLARAAWARDVATLTESRSLIVASPGLLLAAKRILLAIRLGNPEAIRRAASRLDAAVDAVDAVAAPQPTL